MSNYEIDIKNDLNNVWIAAHLESKISRKLCQQFNLQAIIDYILSPEFRMNLRVKGYMLLGISRITLKKQGILLSDCQEVYQKLRSQAKDKSVDLNELLKDKDLTKEVEQTTKEVLQKKKVVSNPKHIEQEVQQKKADTQYNFSNQVDFEKIFTNITIENFNFGVKEAFTTRVTKNSHVAHNSDITLAYEDKRTDKIVNNEMNVQDQSFLDNFDLNEFQGEFNVQPEPVLPQDDNMNMADPVTQTQNNEYEEIVPDNDHNPTQAKDTTQMQNQENQEEDMVFQGDDNDMGYPDLDMGNAMNMDNTDHMGMDQEVGPDQQRKDDEVIISKIRANTRHYKPPSTKYNNYSKPKSSNPMSLVNDPLIDSYLFSKQDDRFPSVNADYISHQFDLNNQNKVMIKIDISTLEPSKSSLIKVFTGKTKTEEGIDKPQDTIDTNVESDPDQDSSLNINIKQEVDMMKLVKLEEQKEPALLKSQEATLNQLQPLRKFKDNDLIRQREFIMGTVDFMSFFNVEQPLNILPTLSVEVDPKKIQKQLLNNLKRKRNCFEPDEGNIDIENQHHSFAYKPHEVRFQDKNLAYLPEKQEFNNQQNTRNGQAQSVNMYIPSMVGVNPHGFNFRKLNLISGESKLLSKNILQSKYWVEEGELEIVGESTLHDAAKAKNKTTLEVMDDQNENDVQFDLVDENIDLTDPEGARFDFSGAEKAAQPDQVFTGDAEIEGLNDDPLMQPPSQSLIAPVEDNYFDVDNMPTEAFKQQKIGNNFEKRTRLVYNLIVDNSKNKGFMFYKDVCEKENRQAVALGFQELLILSSNQFTSLSNAEDDVRVEFFEAD